MVKVSVLSAIVVGAASISTDEQHKVNPIRRVVTMLQQMQNKVMAEGAQKKEIFDKFMCYCDNADTLLAGAIQAAENKLPLVDSQIKEDAATKKQLDSDVQGHVADRAAAKDAISKATAVREKENTAFLKEEGDLKTNIAGLDSAIASVENGGTGFLQTSLGSKLRDLSVTLDMSEVDRQMLSSFLTSRSGSGQLGEILGILKNMNDEMKKSLEDATADENAAVAAFNELVTAKKKEIDALTASIESKAIRSGELAVKHAEMLNDFEDTQEDLAESKKFLADLDGNCEQKRKEWSVYQQMQGQEQLALADTIKILNDDDALELFKKTLPGSSASFLQFKSGAKDTRRKALAVLKASRVSNDPRLDFLEVALRGGKMGFDKIIDMINKLVVQLKEDQKVDDEKKGYCDAEFDKSEDKKKSLENTASDLETAIDDATESISNLKVEIEALDDGIRALDKEVEVATANRKEEHENFVATAASNKAAVDLLNYAKNRLNKFYNPKQYEPPAKRELADDEQIVTNMGYSFMQLSRRGDAAPPPPPEANLAYKTKGEESAGVIAMMDNLINDVEKDIQESDLEEKDAQEDYEKFMGDAASKRAEDSKSMTDKQAALGTTEEELVDSKQSLHNTQLKLMETEKYIGGLHAECDWLLKYYEVRKEARTGEIEAMENAKAVLSGADYS